MRGHLITHLVESALKGVQTLHCIITPFFFAIICWQTFVDRYFNYFLACSWSGSA